MHRAFSCPGRSHPPACVVSPRHHRALRSVNRATNPTRRVIFSARREKSSAARANHSARREIFSTARAFCSAPRAGELGPPSFLLGPPREFLGARSYFLGRCSYVPGLPSYCTRRPEQKAWSAGLFSRGARGRACACHPLNVRRRRTCERVPADGEGNGYATTFSLASNPGEAIGALFGSSFCKSSRVNVE